MSIKFPHWKWGADGRAIAMLVGRTRSLCPTAPGPILVCIVLLLAGCSSNRKSAASQSSQTQTGSATSSSTASGATSASTVPQTPAIAFQTNQMVGKFVSVVSFDPNASKETKAEATKRFNGNTLVLNGDSSFTLTQGSKVFKGLWRPTGEYLLLKVTWADGKSMDEIKKELIAKKKATPQILQRLDAPAMFKISADGSQLSSPTPSKEYVVTLKRVSK